MQVSEIFESLSYGVLSNLAIGGEGCGTIPTAHEPKLIHFLNQCLTEMHGKFNLAEKELVISASSGRTLYPLEVQYAVSDAAVVEKFIVDTILDPFLDDVMKIVAVFDEEGEELVLNDSTNPASLFTPNFDTIQIPGPVDGDGYFIIYQAKHPKLVNGDLTQSVIIPEILFDPLFHYVAYKAISPMNGPEHAAKASEHYQRYDMLCQQIIEKDLVSTSLVETGTTKLMDRGFK